LRAETQPLHVAKTFRSTISAELERTQRLRGVDQKLLMAVPGAQSWNRLKTMFVV
jgi:hypothetical protein